MWRYLNGSMLKVLGVLGIVFLTMLILILLDWIATYLMEPDPDDLWKVFISLFTLLIGGTAGTKYVSGLEVTKKDSDG